VTLAARVIMHSARHIKHMLD